MADKKISELDLALQINNDAEFPFSQDNAGEPTTFKGRITQLGTKIAEDMTFSNLQTTSKKLVGAINELLSLGNPIILGTTAPTSSIGADGNLYVQYTAGTGGADDTVDGIFVKIDGSWCEISTGGGSGTTDYGDLSNKPQVNSVELVGNKSLDDLGIMPASLSKTVSGAIAHITDGANNIPVKSLKSQIVAVEMGSGKKSPDNPYTISGFNSGVITRCGKNFIDTRNIDTTTAGIHAWSDNNGIISLSGTRDTSSGWKVIKTFTDLPLGDYVFRTNNSHLTCLVNYTNTPTTFTVNEGDVVRLALDISIPSGTVISETNIKVQIELGNQASEFEAYNGNTYTFTFGQTVYGGHFDNKGNLVVTHSVLDLGSVNWQYNSSLNVFAYNLSDMPLNTTLLCEQYEYTDVSRVENIANNQIWNRGYALTPHNILIKDTRYTDPTTFKTAVSGVKLVYELATPITLSITSQDIPTLLGENNIFSNCGDVEVNYYTDNADGIVDLIESVGTGGFQPVIYSEDEREIGVWVDGKPLYQKTYEIDVSTLVVVSDWTTIDSTINGEVMAGMEISVKAKSDYSSRSIAFRTDYVDPIPRFTIIQGAFKYFTDSSTFPYNNYVWTITLRYTKTTDTPGSGQWTPQGVPAHHYSTDEQVVGTWIDGSTVYEKTFDLGSDISISNTELTETSIDATNISKLIQVTGMYSTGITIYPLMANIGNNKIRLQSDINGNVGASVRYIILRYTKTT